MKIITHLKSGALRSLKSWKGVLIIWILLLFLISLLALPVKSGFKSMIGSSMITELLTESVNVDVISDLSTGLKALMPALTTGFLMVCFLGFLLNVFVTGGLFTILSNKNNNHSLSHFFAGAATNFWSVLVITMIISLIIFLSGLLLGGLPMAMVSGFGSKTAEPGAMGKTIRISLIIMALVLPVLLLVADFARGWLVAHDERKPFKAIGFGFSKTFKSFFLSYPLMLILMIIQAGFGALVVSKQMLSKPDTGKDVFLLFVTAQILFIIRIFLRTWRYGSVTSIIEVVSEPMNIQHEEKVNQPVIDFTSESAQY